MPLFIFRGQPQCSNERIETRGVLGVRQKLCFLYDLFVLYSAPLSIFDWNSFCLQPVFCRWHTATSVLSSWSDKRHCPDHADMHLWREDLDDTKQTETEWRDRAISLWSQIEPFVSDAQPTSLRVDIPFTPCARRLGFLISDNMTLDKHIWTVCCSAYVKINHISSIRQYLSVEASKTLVCVIVHSSS